MKSTSRKLLASVLLCTCFPAGLQTARAEPTAEPARTSIRRPGLAMRLGLGPGLAVQESWDGSDDVFPCLVNLDFGIGLALGKYIDLEADLSANMLVFEMQLQGGLSLLVFPLGRNGIYLRAGIGYFYSQFCFDCEYGPRISRGMAIQTELGWCWRSGLCMGLAHTGNLLMDQNRNGGSYASNIVKISFSFMFDVARTYPSSR